VFLFALCRLLTAGGAASVCLAAGLKSGARLWGRTYTGCFGSVNAHVASLLTIFYSKGCLLLLFFFNLKDLIYINFKQIKDRIGWI